jgi:hypothetical protein
MTPTKTLTIAACLACGLAGPASGASMAKLRQCSYAGPVMTTCSGLMDGSVFQYTDGKLCNAKRPAYTILATAMGMHKYAVEIRRAGRPAPVYRLGTSGYRKAAYSFRLDGAFHLVGGRDLLVIRPAGKNRVVEVWRRGRCRTVRVDVDALEKKVSRALRAK